MKMQKARIYTDGPSQIVRLPKECQIRGKEAYVREIGGIVMLIPKDDPWAALVGSLDQFSDDFMEERSEPPRQKRKSGI